VCFVDRADACTASHPNYENFEDLLDPGWIFGRKVDNSDSQYASFRDNVPYLLALTIVHPLLRKMYNKLRPVSGGEQSTSARAQQEAADARKEQRITFDFFFTFVFLVALHGFSAFKVLLILYINYMVATKMPKQYVVYATWGFNIGTLFANELCSGYPYGWIVGKLIPWEDPKNNWGSPLDGFAGLMPRWEILFNITVLRLISFNLDYHWSRDRSGTSALEVSPD
jgi:hypothetical protein